MKTMKRNQRDFYYCLYQGVVAITDANGNKTGEQRPSYTEPVEMSANISPAGGVAQNEVFGNLENYDKVIVTEEVDCPIDEHSVLFVDKEPEHSIGGEPMYDYTVIRVAKSINSVSYAIRKVSVN